MINNLQVAGLLSKLINIAQNQGCRCHSDDNFGMNLQDSFSMSQPSNFPMNIPMNAQPNSFAQQVPLFNSQANPMAGNQLGYGLNNLMNSDMVGNNPLNNNLANISNTADGYNNAMAMANQNNQNYINNYTNQMTANNMQMFNYYNGINQNGIFGNPMTNLNQNYRNYFNNLTNQMTASNMNMYNRYMGISGNPSALMNQNTFNYFNNLTSKLTNNNMNRLNQFNSSSNVDAGKRKKHGHHSKKHRSSQKNNGYNNGFNNTFNNGYNSGNRINYGFGNNTAGMSTRQILSKMIIGPISNQQLSALESSLKNVSPALLSRLNSEGITIDVVPGQYISNNTTLAKRAAGIYYPSSRSISFASAYLGNPVTVQHELAHAADDLNKAGTGTYRSESDPQLLRLFNNFKSRGGLGWSDKDNYLMKSAREYYAEGKAIFNNNPNKLRQRDPGLYNYFANGG